MNRTSFHYGYRALSWLLTAAMLLTAAPSAARAAEAAPAPIVQSANGPHGGAIRNEEERSSQAGGQPAAETAENLTAACRLTADFTSSLSRLTDDDKESARRIPAGKSVTISWPDGVSVEAVYAAFYFDPLPYTVLQHDASGALLSETDGALLWNNVIEPADGARSMTIRAGAEEIALCTLHAYGAGEIPNYHPWQPTPEKADYLLIAMHPDDDALFLGAVIPVYGLEQGREGVMLYMASRVRERRDEAMNGAWTMGLRTLPVFGGFPDIPPEYRAQFEDTFRRAEVVRYLVRQLRKYRPEVVVSQDLNGEYGHWQHVLLANAVLEAAPLAADASYDPASVEQYGVWTVKKVYLHLYPENKLELPAETPLAAFGGKTAVQIAAEAFACHVSQLPSRHAVTNEGIYSLSDFGLAYSTVGPDTPGGNDLFENIDPAVLRAAATPMPEPTSAPTPEPTSAPTPEPTSAPTEPPAATPAATPTANPAAAESEGQGSGALLFALIALIVLLIGCIAWHAAARRAARRRKRRRTAGRRKDR